ncbi:tagaturonate reductase [Flagellimonas meridianipacifica]|uniref:Tagaturonate reductase n=2 Tax=Flagellimonas meridianipacifica TaxID=1080225 RepID=A0A2T0MFD7_9FLAO|nr:tagaturonate reductase [Allomuricauda pacifica]
MVPERPIRVIQFGEGNFLRGFVDWMVDILNEKTNFNGNIQIVQPLQKGMGAWINEQEGLYHVLLEGLEKGRKTQTTRLITSIEGVLNPFENYQAFLELAENPDLEFIVSNTTEAGIVFDEKDDNPKTLPKTFPGKLTALLHHYFISFDKHPPKELKILPCELIEKNGDKLKECVLKYIELWNLSKDFVQWVERRVIFYNTLVDRIVPGFPKDNIHVIQEKLGYEDNLVVKAEPFHLWVIEGPKKLEDLLRFGEAGLNVIFTDDLTPFRTRKVRILNGTHTAMVPIAYLNGFKEVRDAVEDEKMAKFLNQIIFKEIIPTLDMPKEELEAYAYEVLERFKNPFIKHKLLDISLNSISKFRVRVLPSILSYLERYKQVPEGLVNALAHLILFYKGEYHSEKIPIKDNESYITFFQEVWDLDNIELMVNTILSNKSLWDQELNREVLLSDFLKEEISALQ